jgi:hypothetical protein
MQGGTAQRGNRRLERVEAVIQRQQAMASKGDDEGFFFPGEC